MADTQGTLLDLSKMEDLFFCIEVLTKARFSLGAKEEELVRDLDRVITCLTYSSQKKVSGSQDENRSGNAITTGRPESPKHYDTIVDIFSGEVLYNYKG